MSLSIMTNIMSMQSQNALSKTQNMMATASQRLSSGLRINSAADDPAGLAIADRMNSQIMGQQQALNNSNDAISLSQTAEGALSSVTQMAQTMRQLAVQSANSTNTSSDRANLQSQYKALADEITRTIGGTTFNGQNILAQGGSMTFQVGAGTSSFDTITVSTTDLSTDSSVTAATAATIDGTDATNATDAIGKLDTLINTIDTQQAAYGAVENRFNAVVSNLQTSVQNQTSARGRIMDADFATETANFTQAQVLQQAGQAMLSQANSSASNVLTLIRNL